MVSGQQHSTLLNAECRWPKRHHRTATGTRRRGQDCAIYNRVHELDALMGKEVDVTDRVWQVRAEDDAALERSAG